MIVTAMQPSANRKAISATLSIFSDLTSFSDLIERKDRIQLSIKNIAASPVLSSMIVADPKLDILMDVSIIRQNPSRLDEVLNICGDFPPGIY